MLEGPLNSCDALLSFEMAAGRIFSKMEVFRLSDEDSMMRISACMLQMHWKWPL